LPPDGLSIGLPFGLLVVGVPGPGFGCGLGIEELPPIEV